MSSYLVTGGAGFIGSHLVDYLVNQGHKVRVLDNLISGKKENINKLADFVYGSIMDTELLADIFKSIDFCYHLAAIPSVQSSIDKWLECHKVNLGGTINIFDAASKANIPVVYASSAAVYGASQKLPLNEKNNVNSQSPYGFDKYSTEVQARLFGNLKGLKSVGLRFFNVYGERQDPASLYSGVISIFINKLLNNQSIEVFGDGTQERDFIYVGDVVEALIKANNDKALSSASVLNVCTGKGVTINELISTIFDLSGKKVDIRYLPTRIGDIYKSIGNPLAAKEALDFEAKINLKAGLATLT